ncbi:MULTISPECIES: ABC transporter ATP-binding protein [Bifidobacterium]|uniref:ABC transporter ATP-binding protein n=1 Tax=Bifidobacterium TaxID=1678 RepID=UPI001BDD1B5E|nr:MULTISPECIES: ABC transporter ATP-binding protein [Bifidobacterium]MBT1161519.1 ABC transporter ATP-binding protein [Bifidobacterium sp. SO1]MBW3078895.1 ABC transporter ATP-binding protein [Bifidobacterium simiiventris]
MSQVNDPSEPLETQDAQAQPLLSVDGLTVSFRAGLRDWTTVVKGIDYTVGRGEVLGIVGESGCGKSVSSFSILRLHNERTTKYGGSIRFDGRNVFDMSKHDLLDLRGGDIGFIFQNPMSSLNPLMTVGSQLRETVRAHRKGLSKDEIEQRCLSALRKAGADTPEEWMGKYPYQFSGGQLQRVVIGMALINEPKLLIADEPTTALDVTIQMQLLKVLRHLRDELGMSIILISHDMGVVAQTCDRVAVMYRGRIVETAPAARLFADPRHPYTKALLAATPPLDGPEPKRLKTVADSMAEIEAAYREQEQEHEEA